MCPVKYSHLMTRSIDPDGREFPYEQIAGFIAEDIRNGTIPVGRRVPSESQLIETYGVARDTARHAVAHLRELGYVETRPHRGTFVIERKTPEDTE